MIFYGFDWIKVVIIRFGFNYVVLDWINKNGSVSNSNYNYCCRPNRNFLARQTPETKVYATLVSITACKRQLYAPTLRTKISNVS